MIGDHIEIFYDGRKVIDARDATFTQAGKFGVWTKADSIVQFDDLIATSKQEGPNAKALWRARAFAFLLRRRLVPAPLVLLA